MKKILTLLSIFSSSLVFSQSIQLTATTSTGNGEVTDSEIILPVGVKNISTEEKQVKVIAKTLSSSEGFDNYFCWDACFEPGVFTSGTLTIEAGAASSAFSSHLKPNGYVGTASIRYMFFVPGETDSLTFIANFNVTPLGVEKINVNESFLSDFYPNPSTDKVSFNYNTFVNGSKIVVFNALGAKVIEKQLLATEKNASLEVEKLNQGIYFATLEVNGKAIVSKRFIVKR
jgi:hypothetical protein